MVHGFCAAVDETNSVGGREEEEEESSKTETRAER